MDQLELTWACTYEQCPVCGAVELRCWIEDSNSRANGYDASHGLPPMHPSCVPPEPGRNYPTIPLYPTIDPCKADLTEEEIAVEMDRLVREALNDR